MVSRVLVLTGLLLASLPAAAAVLAIVVDELQVEMGKYLDVRIVYDGEVSVGRADLRQWADDFFVDRRDTASESLVSGEIRTTERVRLYPRDVGDWVLERIAVGGAVAGPLRVEVTPTVRDGIDGTPRWLPAPQQVWQGQSFEVGVELALLHPSNQIAVEEPEFAGFDVQTLPREQVAGPGGGQVRLRWRLTAREKGDHQIAPPAMEQRGRGRWRFHLRPRAVQVLPLPSYLPPSVPVGEVTLHAEMTEVEGEPHWQVSVLNRGQLPESVYGMRSMLAAAAGSSVEEIGVSPVEVDEAAGTSVQRYRVPVPAWLAGWGTGPQLELRYFDADQGRLATSQARLPLMWRVPPPFAYVLLAIAVVMLATVVKVLHRPARRWLSIWHLRRSLRGAADVHAIRRLLLDSGGHVSLSAWAAAQPDGAAVDLAEQINAACFSPRGSRDVATLREALRVVQPV